MSETVLNPTTGEVFQQRATDPVLPNVSTPSEFAYQFPTPLDTTEVIRMCEEITVWQALPEKRTALKAETYREITSLAFITGSNLIAFSDGYCPEKFEYGGESNTVTLKNIGTYASQTISDIMHSAAVASANWNGINTLVGGTPAGEGVPGGSDAGTFIREHIANVKEKEVRLGMTLVMNGWDRLLVNGNATTRPLEFDGIQNWFVNECSAGNTNDNSASGSFSATSYDRFLAESCAKPTTIFGHPQAIQEMLSGYMVLGFQGSQIINFADGNRLTPGFNFAGFVNTGVGRLAVVADANFTITNQGGGNFQSKLYALRMTHNGEPLVYKTTQIPLSLKDLAPGCTAVAFEIWAKTALIIKACCVHSVYTSGFTGRVTTTCTKIG